MEKKRCDWCLSSPLDMEYHDKEWGVPIRDDKTLFEFFVLETAQAGLSWATILKKREGYRKAFADFEVEKVAKFSEKKVEKLLLNPGIIRNRLKVKTTVTNAQNFIKIQKEFGSFSEYIWGFTDGKVLQNAWKTMAEVPSTSKESEAMSKDLKKRGFKFCGPTICYAFMQAAGMCNDHIVSCFRYESLSKVTKPKRNVKK